MMSERYIEIGFSEKPTEQQLKTVSETIGKILKTIKVSKYDLPTEVYGAFYYPFSLEAEKTKVDPELTLRVYLESIREKLQADYKNIIHVSLGPGYFEPLTTNSKLQTPTNKSQTW